MDRFIQSPQKKYRLFKPFECIDLIPYSVAVILLLAALYILFSFLEMQERLGSFQAAEAF